MLTLHGSKNGEVTGTESKTYPPVELLLIPSSGMYDVMKNWKQDGFDNEAIAVRSTDEAEWAQAVSMRSKVSIFHDSALHYLTRVISRKISYWRLGMRLRTRTRMTIRLKHGGLLRAELAYKAQLVQGRNLKSS